MTTRLSRERRTANVFGILFFHLTWIDKMKGARRE